ncbi:hypothetical protein [Tropicimonas sediminicola]|uniref:Uncharacterized protein n=1 Tax=Tropicimonas sediminicola TaxID=1031541 RepID=A0A239CFB4_9RHOB|nr:hypothetical protein [Tropicimonas sediminicola]SNS18358.1 hypothetical protein SAMN05421757_101238 [Tropicimonas sediminicola]
MTIEQTKENQPDQAAQQFTAPSRATRSTSRMLAIPMLGLGAASCVAVEFVEALAPDLAALPLIAGPALALAGLLLLLRSQVSEARAAKARRMSCQRIAPYRPVMADGSNGVAALNAVLSPAGERHSAPPRRANVARARAVARASNAPLETHYGSNVRLFPPAPHRAEAQPEPAATRSRTPSASLANAVHFGNNWAQDVDLSPRAKARLEADPFVKRLARIS